MSDALEILVAGQWRAGSGEPIESFNPADGSLVATVAGASADDVDEAVRAGAEAMRDPSWRGMAHHTRAALLHEIGRLIDADAERIAQLQTQDNGKPITETRALVASAAGTFRYVAAALETLDDSMPVARGPYFTMSVHEPLGVVGAITPWNSPIASDAQKVAPALAAGNAVVLKPAEWTPLVALELGRIAERAGLPAGLLSVLPGPGRTVGQALVQHPLVHKVSFTGGTSTGRTIGRIAADKVMPVSLELGGKSPTVVFDDADLDLAVHGVLYGIFSSQGQACIAGSRLFVHRSRYAEVIERLVAKARRITVGDPRDDVTQMGPLVTGSHLESVDSYVRLAESEGGTVVHGGKRLDGAAYDRGNFYAPTIITGLGNEARVCREEIFGPVLVVMPFEDDDELVALANDSDYGLACGLWTEDYRRAWSVARRIEAGTVWVNTYKLLSASAPFGGVKLSGLGREKGRSWIHEYMAQKTLYWGTNHAPFQWPDLF
jgi:acyl-CoA reductase-like NAD-dependent aldehyde dehydrogenase